MSVKVMLDGEQVHSCNSVQEGEEWMVDNIAPEDQDRVTFDADPAALAANDKIVLEPESTPVPDVPPLNHLFRVRNALSLLMTAVEDGHTGTDMQVVMTECNDVLETIWGDDEIYKEMPELREFDEIASQGREALIDWIEDGRPEAKLVEEMRLKDDGAEFDVATPMPVLDAFIYLRKRAKGLLGAIGFGPASFAVPGIREIMRGVDLATKVMPPEVAAAEWGVDQHDPVHQHIITRWGDDGFSADRLQYAAIPLAEFEENRHKMPRSSLQLVARG